MEIIANIYDKDLNNVGYLYNVSELVRTHKYREPGKFSMRLPASASDVGLMMTGFIIVFSDDTKEGYLIETVEPSEDYPNVAEIAGRDLRAVFAMRIIQNMTVDGSMSNRMWWMIHNHAVAPSDSNRALPFVQDLDRSPVGDDIGPAANQQLTGKNLLTALTDTVGQDAYGWRCDLNLSEKTITPVFYRGADRTKTVLFDDVLCTMDSCDYTRDVSKYCNVATVAGEGEGSARKYAGIDITGTASGTFAGFSRRELFVDARDLQSETEDASGNKTTMSDADYTKVLQTRGLEMLKANIGMELVESFDELQKFFGEKLTNRALDEFERLAGIFGDTVQNNAKRAATIVNASFHHATFSDRIWMYQDVLKSELSKLLEQGMIQGKGSRELARSLRKVFDTSRSDAERLMSTELRRVQTEAAKQSYEANENDEYEFMTANAQGPCDVCKKLNGKIFKVKDMMPGKNAPPMHPRCHCCTAPHWDEAKFQAYLREENRKMHQRDGAKKVAENSRRGIIKEINGFLIGKSLGAKAKNYDVEDKATGVIYRFVEGTRIQNPKVFAGYKGVKPLYQETLEGLKSEYPQSSDKWQHCKGIGWLDVDGEEIKAEVHWFQEPSVGKVKFKVKRWLDED